ncbi:MAG: PhoH family protein [Deltaproteobacteria bacterium]|nr:PhoH family protein [Deltaproteobacteria bacterium]
MKKQFVLDTNVLLHTSDCINSFGDNEVILPIEVIEELDNFKRSADEKGRNARQVIRSLDRLRTKGKLGEGVPLENGGTLRIVIHEDLRRNMKGLSSDIVDNRIIWTAYYFKKNGNKRVIFVSKDINARIKADALGLEVMDFEKQKINFDEVYSGWQSIQLPSKEIDRFYEGRELPAHSTWELRHNQFVRLEDEANPKHTALGKYLAPMEKIVPLFHQKSHPWGIKARNMEQHFAIELLLCDDIQLVTLLGSAGTGKTLLALACGITKVVEERIYTKLLVSRPIIPFGRDIGYLPGDKEEKMKNWMQPIFDNLHFLADSHGENGEGTVDYLLQGKKLLELEALTYIRGRSIPRQYIIIDEAQNLTPHEIKTIISRAGEGTKMVLTGDPYQIDSPYLDSSSNGLSYAVERMKGQKMFGHITLTHSERSELSSVAAKIL